MILYYAKFSTKQIGMMYENRYWSDIIDEEYDSINNNSFSIIQNIYSILDITSKKYYIESDINNIYKYAEDSEYFNMNF